MYNLDNLTDSEVKLLISESKRALKDLAFNITLGKFKLDKKLISNNNNIEYRFCAYRGSWAPKYSIHIRFEENNLHLVRLCINGQKHHNHDKTIVSGNHIHIYTTSSGSYEGYAYELSNFPFDKNKDLGAALDDFMCYTHIK
jgi:hypothetical protein